MFNTVFIVPTGIGASIGGHSGDATPAFKLIASLSDIAITHPNVVNASDINEMPDNTWYVEGSILDRFLDGRINLVKPRINKILLVTNKPIQPETINAINAARYTIGCDIEYMELETEFRMVASMSETGASGEIFGYKELIEQTRGHVFDALAIATRITVPKPVALDYFENGGINPWGGVEAIASKVIAKALNKPVAHAPVEQDDDEMKLLNHVVDPRMAAEMLSIGYIHCVFKGLHRAPRPALSHLFARDTISQGDIACMVAPLNCYGPPHIACLKSGIPIIAVEENTTCLQEKTPNNYLARTYLEAAGIVQLIKTGMSPSVFIKKEG